jgi:IclR family pca regulon transcriptional regulator
MQKIITPTDNEFISSLEKGLRVLKTFSQNRRKMTISEVAEYSNMSKAASRRYLLTFNALGYINVEGRYFSLTAKILTFSAMYLNSDSLADVATPISQLQGDDIIYIARVPTKKIMSINLQVGARLPAWITSMGRVQMAYLDQKQQNEMVDRVTFESKTAKTIKTSIALKEELKKVKSQGYALVDQEIEEGVISIAVPIFNRNNKVIAGLNIAGSPSVYNKKKLVKEILPALNNTAELIRSSNLSS